MFMLIESGRIVATTSYAGAVPKVQAPIATIEMTSLYEGGVFTGSMIDACIDAIEIEVGRERSASHVATSRKINLSKLKAYKALVARGRVQTLVCNSC